MIVPGSTSPLLMAAKAPEAAYRTTHVSATLSATFSFTSDFGAAEAGRVIAVLISSTGNSNSLVSAVTIGGVAATIVTNTQQTSSGASLFAIAYAVVPTNTSQAISVTLAAAKTGIAVSVYALTGLESSTPLSQASTSGGNVSALSVSTINGQSGGVVLAGATAHAEAALSCTWSAGSMVEDYDANYANSYSHQFAAHRNMNATANPMTITGTFSGMSTSAVLGAVSWK